MSSSQKSSESFERLPTFARPTNYKISLKPDLNTFTFTGQQTVQLELESATNYLKLYAAKLEIRNATVSTAAGKDFTNLAVEYDEKWETARINLPTDVAAGKITLSMEFTGELNDKMRGFYRSSYKTLEGELKYMASTQFESTWARLCFPCWDEPIYKATFDLSLTVKREFVALSNMNVTSENELSDGWKQIQFATTPVMSTYLVAFAVGDFAYLEDKTADGVLVRTYALPHNVAQTKFALEVAVKALDFYNEFFQTNYPLPKCDLIAVPDFSMGAMENWGLVTYREILLLVDPVSSSQSIKIRVALTVAHELAHMWFGNLVTMEWWTDLWLKEGFATFMQYHFVSIAYPEFRVWESMVCQRLESSLELDALANSHPIEVQIDNPNELAEIYDMITYGKAPSIIRMLFFHSGTETFRKGLALYLDRFKYSNAVTLDLWDALGNASGTDVCSLMCGWTKQMGFPVLSVQSKREGNKLLVTVSQKHFLADGAESKLCQMWRVPICVCTASEPNNSKYKLLLEKQTQDFELDGVGEKDWVKLNVGFTGYYRVQYSDEMLNDLLPALNKETLDTVDRYNIVSDIFALVCSGGVNASHYMSVLSNLQESSFMVWNKMSASIGVLSNLMSRTSASPSFLSFVRNLCEPLANKLGWQPSEGESVVDQQLRALVLMRLAMAKHEPTIETAREKFVKFTQGETLNADLRRVVLRVVTRYGGAEGFESVKKVLETNEFVEVTGDCILALAASDHKKVQLDALDYAMKSPHVRPQNLTSVFVGATSTTVGQGTTWIYVKSHFEDLIDKFGDANSNVFQACIKLAASNLCTEEAAEDVEEFISATKHAKTLDRVVKQICEEIRLNARMLERDAPVIEQWLKQHKY